MVGGFDSADNIDDKATMQVFGPTYLSYNLEETCLQF